MEIDRIMEGDCLEVMKQFPDKCFDLVLTDPPYGIGEAAGKNESRGCLAKSKDYGYSDWDDKIPDAAYFDEIFRVSKNQIIFGGNYFILPPSSCWLVWDKLNGKTDFADCELVWTSFDTAVRKFSFRWQGMLQEDMKHKEKRYHPTQKPVKLFMQIIEKYSQPGETILDPFLGSGTTAIAAYNTGRHCVGIEKIPAYVDIARERLAALPMRLDNWSQ